ncbi:LAME_0G01244g1_1 [Lachancea meyersii CBS 8951]|uniref:Succinate dehydrogenase assembly factor 3 n=1 Tax=Lachancea meyersii CBS 8951 TaxID=1266667 RepID=A0A1G4K5C0_9SACH|nr:LAME_0G01244g1_1 [Lachancea meyersii CBS 8951]
MFKPSFSLLKDVVKITARGRKGSNPGKPLLPPLQLFRRILREHRNLPAAQRELGDQYVKNEFKLHKDTSNPLHIVGFLASWQDYLHIITQGQWQEATLSAEVLDKMSPDQVTQLYELMKEAESLRQSEKVI